MRGKLALVTGAGEGIGRAIAMRLGEAGAAVAVVEIDADSAKDAEAELREHGVDAMAVVADVGDPAQARRAVDQALARWHRLDILVNNAGIGIHAPFEEITVEQWDRVLAVNLRAPFILAQASAPHLRRARGSIVNIASTRAFMSEPNTEPYSASKGGLVALTHALAITLGPHVRVNCISPGWIETSLWRRRDRRRSPELRHVDHAQHPVGRVGRPEDVAAACLFLVSDDAGFMTGANVVLDGGMTVKMLYEP
ncbi:MAG: glucose 1-dehydrogenase [Limnochordaceae bacterium]|nr:glucose 1-dehydrogenase [Limnochordaceae bacterium]